MARWITGLLLVCLPLLLVAQQPDSQKPNLSTDTTFPGDKPAKTTTLPDAPTPNVSPNAKPDSPAPGSPSDSSEKPAANPPAPESAPLPHSDGVSSSKVNPDEIVPPPGDDKHQGADLPSDVEEMRPWDPHKADKDLEVGQFYYKRQNYEAAESRFQEALKWQWNHAEATFWLAQTEEKLKKPEDARKYYSTYLAILRNGPEAEKARKALDRLGGPVPVTAQNTNDLPSAGTVGTQTPKAHPGVKDKLKDLEPGCVHLGNGPCVGRPATKDPS